MNANHRRKKERYKMHWAERFYGEFVDCKLALARLSKRAIFVYCGTHTTYVGPTTHRDYVLSFIALHGKPNELK